MSAGMMNRVRASYITNAIVLLGFCIVAGVAQAGVGVDLIEQFMILE